jgi:hypothetical protein
LLSGRPDECARNPWPSAGSWLSKAWGRDEALDGQVQSIFTIIDYP